MADIRPALPADLAAIQGIARAAYLPYVARIGRPPAPMVADFADAISNGQVWVVGAPVAGFVIAYARADCYFVENIAVAPSAQGRGLGAALLGFAEAAAVAAKLPAVGLYTNALMTENLRLYPRLGYVETGRRHEDGFDRVYFRKPVT